MDNREYLRKIGKGLKQAIEPEIGEVLQEMTSDEVNRFYDGLTDAADRHDEAPEGVKFSDMIPDDIMKIYEKARDRVIEQK